MDGIVGHGGPAIAEVDDAAHAVRRLHLAELGLEIEAREQVAGKQRLGEPRRAANGHSLEPDAGKKDGRARNLPDVIGGNVFALGLGFEAEPGGHDEMTNVE
jgi:hypothetical protein